MSQCSRAPDALGVKNFESEKLNFEKLFLRGTFAENCVSSGEH